MTIKTKYNIGDVIFFMSGQIPTKGIIEGCTVFTGKKKYSDGAIEEMTSGVNSIQYHVQYTSTPIHEEIAFPSKEDLQKHLFENV